jgi:hypothetical protein
MFSSEEWSQHHGNIDSRCTIFRSIKLVIDCRLNWQVPFKELFNRVKSILMSLKKIAHSPSISITWVIDAQDVILTYDVIDWPYTQKQTGFGSSPKTQVFTTGSRRNGRQAKEHLPSTGASQSSSAVAVATVDSIASLRFVQRPTCC